MYVKQLILLPLFWLSGAEWHQNLGDAEKIAQQEHKFILLNFSGSDWCGPCIRMKKEIFESGVFKEMADRDLVLVNADFPRNKKNQLTASQQKINDELADKYNSQGRFPFTLLLNASGIQLKSWDGLPDESADNFSKEIKDVIKMNNAN